VRGLTGLVRLRTAEAMVNQLLFLRQFVVS
jgi:hypothetical protein